MIGHALETVFGPIVGALPANPTHRNAVLIGAFVSGAFCVGTGIAGWAYAKFGGGR